MFLARKDLGQVVLGRHFSAESGGFGDRGDLAAVQPNAFASTARVNGDAAGTGIEERVHECATLGASQPGVVIAWTIQRGIKVTGSIGAFVRLPTLANQPGERGTIQQDALAPSASLNGILAKRSEFQLSVVTSQTGRLCLCAR